MKHRSTQINSFFIEMIIVILFFAVSVTVTLQLFVAADNRAQHSSALSIAVIKAENIAEQVKSLSSEDALPKSLETAKQGSSGGGLCYTVGYDKQWNLTDTNPRYLVDVIMKKTKSDGGTLVLADISVNRVKNSGSEKLYTLSSAKYLSSH